jgi:transposase
LDSKLTYNQFKKGDDMAKRRTFSPEFKLQVILELLSGAKTNAQLCREHQIASTVVSTWKEQFLAAAPGIFASPASQSKEQERIAELERLAGRLTLELEMAKKVSSILSCHLNGNGR